MSDWDKYKVKEPSGDWDKYNVDENSGASTSTQSDSDSPAQYARAALGGFFTNTTAPIEAGITGFNDWLQQYSGGKRVKRDIAESLDKAKTETYAKYKQAQEDHPLTSLGFAVASPNPLGRLGATSVLTRILAGGASGAISSGLSSGMVGDDVLPSAALGGVAGAGLGAAGHYIGRAADSVGKHAGGKVDAAWKAAQDKIQDLADKNLRSKISSLGGETSSGSRVIEQLKAAIADGNVTPELKAEAAALLGTENAKNLLEGVTEGNMTRLPNQLNRVNDARLEVGEARKQAALSAVEKATQEKMAHPWQPLKKRVTYYANRAIAPAVGSVFGSMLGPVGVPLGAAAGAVVGSALGHPGTAMKNLLNDPAFRAGGFGALNKAAGVAGSTTSGGRITQGVTRVLTPEAAREASRDHFLKGPDRKANPLDRLMDEEKATE